MRYRTAGAARPARRRAGAPRSASALVDTLAALHAVDPAAVGLADFGRPEGFLDRQVRRWAHAARRVAQPRAARRRRAARTRSPRAVPADAAAPAIVHGDYRLDNVLVDGRRPRSSAPCSTGRWPPSATR